MIRMLMAVIGVGLAAVAATADDKPKPADTPAAKLAAIQKEAKEAEEQLNKQFASVGESKDAQEKVAKLYKEHEEKQKKRLAAALDVAKADPASDTGLEAVTWVLTQYAPGAAEVTKAATDLLVKHHVASPKIGAVVLTMGQMAEFTDGGGDTAEGLLKAVAEKNPDRTVKGQVAMVRAWQAKAKFDAAGKKATDELAAAAEKAFEAVIKEFGDCKLLSTYQKVPQTLAEAARPELFELRNLREGKAAPDIEGEDLDGAKFKLSDYKGKVVLLDFWGDW